MTHPVKLITTSILLFAGSCSAQDIFHSDRAKVSAILADLDNNSLSTEQQLANYVENAVILAPNEREIRGHAALNTHLDNFGANVDIMMNHQIVELDSFEDIVVSQGKVVGTAKPHDDPRTYSFETKNIILFKRTGADLKIWKVIYNAAPEN